ncbi:cation-transporting P-type ATPase [Halomonas sp. MCCC 1A11062]|uniref:cation-transporting P-type ATPase n=1 Tax=Halomonas sp. MCCC 1A11062 TaxID=2733485 RepID=UPI001F4278E0|nr:cation-transporting P-type ATPase [Halomonas sp. MCCC 1A11062]MCE8040128.1 hypothetical protein [Halomonas sp. MCCC 1A11062]
MSLSAKEDAYWSRDARQLLAELGSSEQGLSTELAGERLSAARQGSLRSEPDRQALRLFAHQFRSPLVLILLFGALVSLVVHDWRVIVKSGGWRSGRIPV